MHGSVCPKCQVTIVNPTTSGFRTRSDRFRSGAEDGPPGSVAAAPSESVAAAPTCPTCVATYNAVSYYPIYQPLPYGVRY